MSSRLRWSIAAASVVVVILATAISWSLGVRNGRLAERDRADVEIATLKDNARQSMQNLLAAQEWLAKHSLSDKAEQLLIAAASDAKARCYIASGLIYVGRMKFGTDSRAREAAEWRAALEELKREQLVDVLWSPLAGGRNEYLVSKDGFDYVERLHPELLLRRRPSDGVPEDATLAEFFLLSDEQQSAFIRKVAEDFSPRVSPDSGPKSVERDKVRVAEAIERKVLAYREHADKLKTDYQAATDSIEAKRLIGAALKHEFRELRVR